jgi:hypothetical protein
VLADVLAYEVQAEPALLPLAEARAAYLTSMAWTQDVLARAAG